MSSPDIKASAYAAPTIDRAIASATVKVDQLCHRGDLVTRAFAPWIGTKYFDWPNDQSARSGRLWLDSNQLISLTSFQSPVGTTIPTSAVLLEPQRDGPPYSRIEIDRSSFYALGTNITSQRSVAITGVFGYQLDLRPAGTLSGGINAAVTTITGTPVTGGYGVGDLLKIGTEYLFVTEKAWVSSAQTSSLAASAAAQTLAVADGTVFVTGEELLLDAERVLVRDIAGNNLIVQRAWNGTTIAAHTTTAVYWPRVLTVTRGEVGSTAATHSNGDAITRQNYPGPVEELTRAYAIDTVFQGSSGYARTIGSGDSERQYSGRAIKELAEAVYGGYGRKNRSRAV